jgi:iron complex transport system ATP-binding protein
MTLAAEALAFGYPGRTIGHDASFSLSPGDVLCVLGPNGGGKTTLFRTLLGLLRPHGGRVSLDGSDLRELSRRGVAQRIGYVPQAHSGYFPFTVADVVLMGRTAHIGVFAVPSREDRRIAAGTLETLGIAHLSDSIYTQISGGERQLALIARTLAQQASLMIMDEPTASLDFGNQVRVLDGIRRLAAGGIGVLFSTHDPDHAFLCADRVAILHDGRIAAFGSPAETVTPENLRLAYGVEVSIRELAEAEGTRRVCLPSLSVRASGPAASRA